MGSASKRHIGQVHENGVMHYDIPLARVVVFICAYDICCWHSLLSSFMRCVEDLELGLRPLSL